MTKKHNHRKNIFIKHRDVLICLFLVLSTLSVYWQVLNYGFVLFDDPDYVYNNRHVGRGLTLQNIRWAFGSAEAANWHPLTWLSHMLDVTLYGMNPGAHHLTNLLLHTINTLLLFLVLKKMSGDLWQSACVALLFALHPLHVESVAWISERKDLLSTFFWLLVMWHYSAYASHPTVARYLAVILFLALGLMAKPMLVTLPFVLLLLDYWPLRRLGGDLPTWSGLLDFLKRQRWVIVEKIPLLGLVAVSSVVTFLVQQQGRAVASLEMYSFKIRCGNAMISYAAYMGKMFWPVDLAVLYPHPGAFFLWRTIGACLLIAAITLFALKNFRRRPYLAIGWFWYMGTLIPVIGLVQVGSQALADRYTYVPLIGLFMITSWGAYDLVTQWRYRRVLFTTLPALFISFFMAITWKQTGYWENSITLFAHALEVTSNNYVIHNNLGHVLIETGGIDQGIAHCREAIQINPNYSDAHGTWGNGLLVQGKLDEAVIQYSEALRLNPLNEKTYNNLGVALYKKGKIDEAILHFKKALQLKHGYVMAQKNLMNALARQKNKQATVKVQK